MEQLSIQLLSNIWSSMKINYDKRSDLIECNDNDISLILQIFSSLYLKTIRVCEIPCNKDRNIELSEYCKELMFCDINSTILEKLANRYKSRPNVKFQKCNFEDVSNLTTDLLISLRQSFQMFSLSAIKNFFVSAKKIKDLKYIVFDIYIFDSNVNQYTPSYIVNACPVQDIKTGKTYLRKSHYDLENGVVNLKHQYFNNNKLTFYQEIKMFNHSFKDIETLLEILNLSYKIWIDRDNYKVYIVEVL